MDAKAAVGNALSKEDSSQSNLFLFIYLNLASLILITGFVSEGTNKV